ncbi:retinal cone rhodopsin-sensitive cGMP 3',5'-cyclic phosphodiesterase subunit gamma isoform 1-T1 [Pangshura tecta]
MYIAEGHCWHMMAYITLVDVQTGRFERGVPCVYNDPRMSDANTLNTTEVAAGPTTPRKGPPKFKQRQTRQFKSKPPKKGVKGFGDDIPGMEGLGTDITVICPWEAFSHLELHELAQFGII